MSSDAKWSVGDHALSLNGEWWKHGPERIAPPFCPAEGVVYVVAALVMIPHGQLRGEHVLGLVLEEIKGEWEASCFRKVDRVEGETEAAGAA